MSAAEKIRTAAQADPTEFKPGRIMSGKIIIRCYRDWQDAAVEAMRPPVLKGVTLSRHQPWQLAAAPLRQSAASSGCAQQFGSELKRKTTISQEGRCRVALCCPSHCGRFVECC